MTVHFFHVTNGQDVLFDRRGKRISNPDRVTEAALAHAQGLMRQLPGYGGWRSWSVLVHNSLGDWIETVPFPPPPPRNVRPMRGKPGILQARPARASALAG
jgi:hypothetical protein